jgi:hypothetical protein
VSREKDDLGPKHSRTPEKILYNLVPVGNLIFDWQDILDLLLRVSGIENIFVI